MLFSEPYFNSSLLQKIELQKKTSPNTKPVCLFSDLDDSYLMKYWPTEDILDKYSQKYTDTILSPDSKIYEPTIALKRYLDQHNIPLIIVSGRDIHQINELTNAFAEKLPFYPEIMRFDAVIGAVGTEIYIKKNNAYEIDTQYQQLLKKTSFDRNAIYRILKELIPVIRSQFHPLAFDFSKRDKTNNVDELPKQPYKISLEFKSDASTSEKIEKKIKAAFKENNLHTVKLLLSSPYRINKSISKFNLDIVPFSKDKPITYLKSLLNVISVVAADSGNDFDMISKAADYGIVVGNAKRELISSVVNLKPSEKKHILISPSTLTGPDAILHAIQQYKEQ